MSEIAATDQLGPLVAVRDVFKTFAGGAGSTHALAGVSLSVQAGERVAIVGRSGSGKSTLLNLIAGIDRPSAGRVEVLGVDLGLQSESQLAAFRGRNIGIVFQFFQLIPTLTVRENVLLAMELSAVIPKNLREGRTVELLRQVEMCGRADTLPSSLSGGEQQRAAIARAMANEPPLLVADEPTGNLDSRTAALVVALLGAFAESGKAVLLVTHDEHSLTAYDRVIRLRDGRIDASGGGP